MVSRRPSLLVAAVLLVGTTGVAFAAPAARPFDHLQCFRIKDSLAKASYTADITAANPIFVAAERGCTILTPAKMLCVDARKTSVEPIPPGAPDGEPAQTYLCYRARCGKTQPSTVLDDQFGTHLFAIKSATMICAPVAPIGSSTTTTTLPPCPDADEDGYTTCNGDCDDSNPSAHPGAEEFCDGFDGNCNGLEDLDDDQVVGQFEPCDTDYPGVCSAGIQFCEGDGLHCYPQVQPGTQGEVCDGLDNDCNGLDDDGIPGVGNPCFTNLPGICGAGTIVCDGVMECMPNTAPSDEVCDGLDNDCDGIVDEGDPMLGLPCNTGNPGVCAAGTLGCAEGDLFCHPNAPPSAELCDGLDNDCDGAVDNGVCLGLGQPCGEPAQCDSGACSDGVCCDQKCGLLCEACVMVKTGVPDGFCDFVMPWTDPDNECPFGETCNGAGDCDLPPP